MSNVTNITTPPSPLYNQRQVAHCTVEEVARDGQYVYSCLLANI